MAFAKLTEEQKAEREAQKKAAKEAKAAERLAAAEERRIATEAAASASVQGQVASFIAEETARLNLENAQRLARLQNLQLEDGELGLELKREQMTELRNQRESKKRSNRQRQAQFDRDKSSKLNLRDKVCQHLQGGDPNSPWETGDPQADSTVGAIEMSDGFTMMLYCSLCHEPWYSPHPLDGATALRVGETIQDRDARLAKFAVDKAEFDRIFKLSKKKKGKEARLPMSCGAAFKVTNPDTMTQVLRRRPHEMNMALQETIAQQQRDMAAA